MTRIHSTQSLTTTQAINSHENTDSDVKIPNDASVIYDMHRNQRSVFDLDVCEQRQLIFESRADPLNAIAALVKGGEEVGYDALANLLQNAAGKGTFETIDYVVHQDEIEHLFDRARQNGRVALHESNQLLATHFLNQGILNDNDVEFIDQCTRTLPKIYDGDSAYIWKQLIHLQDYGGINNLVATLAITAGHHHNQNFGNATRRHASKLLSTLVQSLEPEEQSQLMQNLCAFETLGDYRKNNEANPINLWEHLSVNDFKEPTQLLSDVLEADPLELPSIQKLKGFSSVENTLHSQIQISETLIQNLATHGIVNHRLLPFRNQPDKVLSLWGQEACENDTRPIALIVQSPEDWNWATGPEHWEHLFNAYRVLYAQADEDSDLTDIGLNAEETLGERNIDLVIFAGHGSKTQLALGDQDPRFFETQESRTLDRGDQTLLADALSDLVAKRANLVLKSCSNGEGGRHADNLASMVSRAIPQARVFAYPDANNARITINSNGFFTGIKLKHGSKPLILHPSQ